MVGLAMLLVVLSQAPNVSEFRGVTYVNAAGWAEQNQADLRTLIAPARPGEFVMLMLFAARPASDDPSADLQALADQAEQQGRRLARGGIERKTFGPYTALLMPSKVELPGVGQHSRIYELVTDGRTSAFATALYRGDASFASNQTSLLQIMASVKPGAGPRPTQQQARAPAQRDAPVPPPSTGTGIPFGVTNAPVFDKAFRPSGRGVPIPSPSLEAGVPVGLWWNVHVGKAGSSIYATVFLPDRTVVRFFRPGGPTLVDLEGMRALHEDGYIGRYDVSGGVLTTTYGEFRTSKPITTRSSATGPYFLWNYEEYQPALPLSQQLLVGTWRMGAMGTYTFRADGTVITTPPMIDATSQHPNLKEQLVGTWVVDGYLLALQFPVDGTRVYFGFRTATGLVIGQSLLERE